MPKIIIVGLWHNFAKLLYQQEGCKSAHIQSVSERPSFTPPLVPIRYNKLQYTPPTPPQLNSTVELRRRRRCVLGFTNWRLAVSR